MYEYLSCPIHKETNLERVNDTLVCKICHRKFPINSGIPCLEITDTESELWNPWSLDVVKMTGDTYYKRTTGELPEKEASKSFARFLRKERLYTHGDTVLDYGCATGHFLRSFRKHLDENIKYTGIDSHFEFLRWGSEHFGITDNSFFVHGDVTSLPFMSKSFDISVVNLFHFFPDIEACLKEALRVTRKYIVWRTPIGNKANYIVKIILDNDFKKLGILHPDKKIDHDLYMLFTEKYITDLVESLGYSVKMILRDIDFEGFNNTVLPEFASIPSTRTVGKIQINGSLVLDWKYVVIKCSKSDVRFVEA